jgi:aryl-alcohol dehydrogenase-like predicted oxidoreductase
VFGKTGLQVSQIALGTGNFGTGCGHGADARESEAIFNAYAEAGGNFIDTADVYQFGQSEEILDTVSGVGPSAPARKPVPWTSDERTRRAVA